MDGQEDSSLHSLHYESFVFFLVLLLVGVVLWLRFRYEFSKGRM